MNTHPKAGELVRAVAQWIDEVRPQLDQRNGYLARVAMNALAIVERELSASAAAKSEMTPHLSALLNRTADYDTLIRELCDRLREGKMSISTPGLLEALRIDTLARLAIDQPNYRHEKSE